MTKDSQLILSVAQFRPEKNHSLQLRAFAQFLDQRHESSPTPTLALVGSCRNDEDLARVSALRAEATALGISPHVHFHLNVSFSSLVEFLQRAHVGLHTMANEHFGIGVVELMAAGVITIAHRSGGPLEDIVIDCDDAKRRVGYLAASESEYARCLSLAFGLSTGEVEALRRRARTHAQKFSDEVFQEHLVEICREEIFCFDSKESG